MTPSDSSARRSGDAEYICPYCDAEVMPDWSRCWICQEPLNPGDAILQAKPRSVGDVLGIVLLAFTAILILFLVTGVARSFGLKTALLSLLAFAPTFLVALTRALVRRQTNESSSVATTIAFGLLSTLSIIVSFLLFLVIIVISFCAGLLQLCSDVRSQGTH